MSGLGDFLFEGKSPPSVTTFGSSTSSIPQWMNDYNQGLVSRANQIAAEPYQQYGGPRVAGFTDDTQNAFNLARSSANAYQTPLTQALGLTNDAVTPGQGGLATASPYLQNASKSFPGSVSQYMDPYVGNVIDRAKLEANRNYNENILPTLSNKFTANGQYGSSAMQREADRAARDLTEGLDSQAAAQLSGAYQSAGTLFNQDQNRQLGLAQTAGQLGTQQQTAQLEAGRQMGALGAAQQQLGLSGAQALDAIGQEQQGLNQRNLDTAYQDFQNQTNYPRQTVDWLSSVIHGMPAPVSSTSTKTGPADAYQPSGLAQLGSAASNIAGLWKLFQDDPSSASQSTNVSGGSPSDSEIYNTGQDYLNMGQSNMGHP